MKLLKAIVPKPFRDQESILKFKDRLKEALGDEYKVIILEGGIDLKPVENEYWGIQSESGEWTVDISGNVQWYPCKEIAEINAANYKGKFKAVSFNGITEA